MDQRMDRMLGQLTQQMVALMENQNRENSNPTADLEPKFDKEEEIVTNFNIDDRGLHGSGFHEGVFAYCWSAACATVGITGGRYCFGCKIVSVQPVDMSDTPPEDQHLCSIGISRVEEPVENLGETQHSFGFGSTRKFLTAGKFSDYGEEFGIGDTIVCHLDIESAGNYSDYANIGFRSRYGGQVHVGQNQKREYNQAVNGQPASVMEMDNTPKKGSTAIFQHQCPSITSSAFQIKTASLFGTKLLVATAAGPLNHLSYTGRLQLIMSILNSLLSVILFVLPKKAMKQQVEQECTAFLWKGDEKNARAR
ncbi:hypothetical protein CDL15_Pgr013036 [Punica granatum]|uniref:B30.2/SPRY domain-containing protein n=1 Tax=Punica granatum TaxID=22663 RepID=A0A218WJ78_PUNGR|nr:hypothetical protein CDL15_Pgr013036 [Punica granatum]